MRRLPRLENAGAGADAPAGHKPLTHQDGVDYSTGHAEAYTSRSVR